MIRLIDAEKVYDNGTRALKGVSFTVDDGEFVFLVGPSGSGKSTIIKLMTGEVVPTAGRVMVNDKPAKASVQVKTGDTIEIQFGSKNVKVEVLDVKETVKKEDVESMYKYL